jgi:hypothetical protein
MKKLNVPQFYNGFCCYFKFTCSSFDNVIKLFTLSCLDPILILAPWKTLTLLTPKQMSLEDSDSFVYRPPSVNNV